MQNLRVLWSHNYLTQLLLCKSSHRQWVNVQLCSHQTLFTQKGMGCSLLAPGLAEPQAVKSLEDECWPGTLTFNCHVKEKSAFVVFDLYICYLFSAIYFSVTKLCLLFVTPCTAACQASLSFINSWCLLKFMSIESVMLSDDVILCALSLLFRSIFPSIRVFSVSCLFGSGSWNIGASASASVLPMNIQDWFPLGLTGLISLQSKGLSRVFSSTTVWKHQFFGPQASLWSNSHICTWLWEKP